MARPTPQPHPSDAAGEPDRPGRSPRGAERLLAFARALSRRARQLTFDAREPPPACAVPIVLAIDVEPDQRVCDRSRPKPWSGFERCLGELEAVRDMLHRATGAPVRFSWFLRMDPQIETVYGTCSYVVERYGGALARLAAAGDELGLHVHGWRWSDELCTFVSDMGDREWVAHCVRVAFAAFEAAFARRCRSFRFGDRWHDSSMLPLLRELGVVVDLTLEPGKRAVRGLAPDEHTTGMIPSTIGAPERPYRPARDAWLEPGQAADGGPWMLPLSAGLPHAGAREVQSLGYYLEPRAFRHIARRALRASRRPYVAGAIRTDLANLRDMEFFWRNMRWLARHPWRRDFRICTTEEAIARLTEPEPREPAGLVPW